MKILLTNDDGITSTGLQILAQMLRKEHEVWIVAPDQNRSAVSHSIIMNKPLKIVKHDDFSYTCSGVPVDCVVHGLNAVLKSKPDVILSGINFGANLGTDILFSGTAAAARQASLYGIPGIAVSLESSGGVYDFSSLASFTVKNLEHLMSLSDKDIFVNINALSPGPYAECRLTKPSKRYYNDGVKPFIAPDGQHYSFFAGGNVETEGDEDCDYCVLKKGFVSVSRILSQPSAHPYSDSSWEKSCQMS